MVITNAKVVTPERVEAIDVRIENGKIAQMGEGLLGGESLDAGGRYLMPAMIDIGVGVMDGRLRGGTLEKLSANAYVNGFGTVVISSLCTPRIDNEITLEFAKSQAELCRDTKILTLLSGVTDEEKLSDASILLKEGAVGIEFDSSIDGNLIRRLMEYAVMHGIKLFCHANDPALQGDGVMHEGEVSSRLGLGGVPAVAESSQVARIGELASYYGVDVVILAASTPQTLEICSANPHLHAQVPLHHLLLTDTLCDNYNTAGKIWPPLRDEVSRRAMIERLKSGVVSMLTALHTPVSGSAKDAVFSEAEYGIDGLNAFLPLCYTFLVKEGMIDLPELSKLTACRPAETVGIDRYKGKIAVGYDADLILFDPDKECCGRFENSPYEGKSLYGDVERIVL
ncbi:amidohydrolase family protein [Hydrogenimonas cancrithermarum]|uniref:Dihydroorotase n=1 Tax=Hydrogenimonas cancrithermarum TaxID=2993563 RepID=A0ABM8FKL7_9BACT|nr:amidohydrolase family protein [Hydrogenimonas cancrithermarum]BDY12227.1 dihydroorotase [Hydrogenimonas cancrithermarum]